MKNALCYMGVLLIITNESLAWQSQKNKRQTYAYEPTSAILIGTIETQTFPGPPNYESITNVDKTERGWFIKLDRAIDVAPGPQTNIANQEPEKNVQIVQVAIHNDKLWGKLKDGLRCKIKGALFHRLTGHHHARVLVFAEDFEPVVGENEK
ncbi:MAG: hypothetical protein HY072_03315 [Deltaproteobacteria bacterium]|nr:hypothetical protein [Deltaproteobacteria bacterium]